MSLQLDQIFGKGKKKSGRETLRSNPMLLFVSNFYLLCLALQHLIYFALGGENSKGKTLKEDKMKEKARNDIKSGRRESKVRDKRERQRENKYQHPHPGSIFFHPVV